MLARISLCLFVPFLVLAPPQRPAAQDAAGEAALCAPVTPEPAAVEPASTGNGSLSVAEIETCLRRNEPRRSLAQQAEFVQYDLKGTTDAPCVAITFEARFEHEDFEDGQRKVRLVFEKPADFADTEYVMHQADGRCADSWVYLKSERRPDRMPCGGGGGAIPCTNFSGEDLTRRYRLNEPGRSERRPDVTLGGRRAYVLVVYPNAQGGDAPDVEEVAAAAEPKKKRKRRSKSSATSEYDKIVSYIDRESCVVLREESYKGEELIKAFSAEASSIQSRDYLYYAASQRIDDCEAGEHTDITLAEPKLDCELKSRDFDAQWMGKRKPKPSCD